MSHTASPEDPEVWLPPSRQPSFTRAGAPSDDDIIAQLALRRPRSSSEAGACASTKHLCDGLRSLKKIPAKLLHEGVTLRRVMTLHVVTRVVDVLHLREPSNFYGIFG